MPSSRMLLAGASVLLAAAGCSGTISLLTVPTNVWAGQVFEVVIQGSADGNPGQIAAILQLPNGFVVEGAFGAGAFAAYGIARDGGTRDDPNVMSLMTAEPGHYLSSFSHEDHNLYYQTAVMLKIYVRAPQSSGGPHRIKVAVAGSTGFAPVSWQVTHPPGATMFATLAGPPFAQATTVTGAPQTPFVLDTSMWALGQPGMLQTVSLRDLDGDGRDDLIHAINPYPAGLLTFRMSRAYGAWVDGGSLPFPSWVTQALGDFDGDGWLDIADSAGHLLFGNGGSAWTPGPALPLAPTTNNIFRVTVGDLDGDGIDDLVYGASGQDTVQAFRSNGNRTFAEWSTGLPRTLNTANTPGFLLLADVDGDGRCDLADSASTTSRVWRGNGHGIWTPANIGLPRFSGSGFVVVDLDRNGHPELLGSTGQTLVAVEFVGGAWQPRSLAGMPTSIVLGSIAVIDYDRDGWQDVVLWSASNSPLGFYSGTLLLLRNLTGMAFTTTWSFTNETLNQCASLSVGDLDGDSWPDLAAAVPGERPLVWRNVGTGSSNYGSACGAIGATTPRTTASGPLQRGSTTFALELLGAQANSGALLWLGHSKRNVFGQPILPYALSGLGAPGCAVLAAPEFTFFVVADAAGRARLPMPIPNDPALQWLTLFAQGACASPNANQLGWLFGDGLALKIP